MRFWIVAPWREEVGFDIQNLLGGDNIPRAELGKKCLDGLVFVPYVVLLELFNLLCVDGCDNGFDLHQVNHLLESVLLSLNFLVRLKLEELSALVAVPDSWVDDLFFLEPFTVQVVVPDG